VAIEELKLVAIEELKLVAIEELKLVAIEGLTLSLIDPVATARGTDLMHRGAHCPLLNLPRLTFDLDPNVL